MIISAKALIQEVVEITKATIATAIIMAMRGEHRLWNITGMQS